MSEKVVYLMRGLPSCGKSYTAKRLASVTGVVCETDEYFYMQVGDDPGTYDYRAELLEAARQWNVARFMQAVGSGHTPIIVDRGNSLSVESQLYARYAVEHGYTVELKEPESAWWQELRVLLKYKRYTGAVLSSWADQLALVSRATHRVSAATIRRRMGKWKYDLTVEEILAFDPKKAEALRNASVARRAQSRKERRGNGQAVSKPAAPRSWVGDFLLNLGAAAHDPNQDIRVSLAGDADGD